jgi:SAM-dependent methyltransferase
MPFLAAERKNLLDLKEEHWRPPVYSGIPGSVSGIKNFFYLFLDLQKSTIERDLRIELPKAKGDVLDVGCGTQPYRGWFPGNTRYTGIDIADSKAHFGYKAPDTIYYSGLSWPVKSRSIDFILCTETLEHVEEPLVFLKEAARVLRPQGRVLLTIPFAVRWHFVPYDYWRYTPSGLKSLLKKAGFEKVKVYARGNQLTVACYKVMGLLFALLSPMVSGVWLKIPFIGLGILGLPLLLIAAILANLSKGMDGSVDCLGYTVLAQRSSAKAR